MNEALDKEVVRLIQRILELDLQVMTANQLDGYIKCVVYAEKKCKWLNTSIKAKNVERMLIREKTNRGLVHVRSL